MHHTVSLLLILSVRVNRRHPVQAWKWTWLHADIGTVARTQSYTDMHADMNTTVHGKLKQSVSTYTCMLVTWSGSVMRHSSTHARACTHRFLCTCNTGPFDCPCPPPPCRRL